MIEKKYWKLYKQSEEGKAYIDMFNKALDEEFTCEDAYDICKSINSCLTQNWGEKDIDYFCYDVDFCGDVVYSILEELPEDADADTIFDAVMAELLNRIDHKEGQENMTYKVILSFITPLSFILYFYFSKQFIPNLFVMQFDYFLKLADKHELELPRIPVRTNYEERCRYYLEMCKVLWQFAKENEIEDPAELCTYIYGLELSDLKENKEALCQDKLPEVASQAWFIGGTYGDTEKVMESGFWQGNELTNRGDILVFYEKAPAKSINAIWKALVDGTADPFFYFYSHTTIGHKQVIPAISLDELLEHPYFKNHSLVKKNFQGVNGWHLTTEDYEQLKTILAAKGFDVSTMPKLYKPEGISPESLNDEADVSREYICKLLSQMGWELGRDYSAEVRFAAGHGETGQRIDKRPDFCLHEYKVNGKPRAKVIIESKFDLLSKDQREKAFDQTETYAGWAHAHVMLICDKHQICVYERNRNGEFNFNDHKTIYRWSDMSDNEKFQELRNKLKK